MPTAESIDQFILNPTAYVRLNFYSQNLTDNDIVRLMNILKSNQTVTFLYLHQNQIGDVGATAIGQGLAQNSRVTEKLSPAFPSPKNRT